MKKDKLTKEGLQSFAFNELKKIIEDKGTTPAVKTQALTQMIKLADELPEVKNDELAEFLGDE